MFYNRDKQNSDDTNKWISYLNLDGSPPVNGDVYLVATHDYNYDMTNLMDDFPDIQKMIDLYHQDATKRDVIHFQMKQIRHQEHRKREADCAAELAKYNSDKAMSQRIEYLNQINDFIREHIDKKQ
jgi:hypothetical protein